MSCIREWCTPRNKHDVQQFLGLVQYLAHFMPDISAYTGPLAAIQKNGHPFLWKPMHQVCMDNIKQLACKTPILRPIDPKLDEPIWVICDASTSGVGAVYGQGPTWQTCRPTGFMSRKFSTAQHNYHIFEMETLAILKALLKWEDKLIRNHLHVVTNHWALEFFKTQRRLSHCQMRWMEYFSWFDYNIQYIKGTSNKVADSLSQYYQSDMDDDIHPTYNYITADVQLDPEGEDLPWNQVIELCTITTRNRILHDSTEERDIQAQELAMNHHSEDDSLDNNDNDDLTLFESLAPGPELCEHIEKVSNFLDKVKKGYKEDDMFSKIIKEPGNYSAFQYREGFLYTNNRGGQEVLCISRVMTKDYSLTAIVIEQAHTILGHFGAQKTADYIRRWYWLP